MEYINRIELQGTVGTVRSNVIGTSPVQNFSLATEFCYRHSDGNPIVETTWHQIVAWNQKAVQKGDSVRVVGRIRQTKYVGSDGTQKILSEVVASELEIIKE